MQKNSVVVNDLFDLSGFGKTPMLSFKQLKKMVEGSLLKDSDADISQGKNWQILAYLDNHHRVIQHSPSGINSTIKEGYFLYQDRDAWVVASCDERGGLSLIGVFPSIGAHNAAEYFVWKVSEGRAKLDWSLYSDMLD